jgi:hypothetical protein
MRQVLLGATLIAALAAAPAIAIEKQALKSEGMKQSGSIGPEDQNRFQNPDGTFQGKPVVQGPAHWNNMEPGATGESSGESGSALEGGTIKK